MDLAIVVAMCIAEAEGVQMYLRCAAVLYLPKD